MHVPWIQLAMEVIEQAAPDIAVELDADEMQILGGLVKLYKWALGRCPEDRPPSASAPVLGDLAAKLIAKAARFGGDSERFVTALEHSSPPLLERVPGGIRIRGLRRYDAAWAKNNPIKAGIWKSGSGTGPEPARNRPGTEAPDTDTDTEEKKEACVDEKPSTAHPLVSAWNELTSPPIPRAKETKGREEALKAAAKRRPTEQWREVFRRIEQSAYCRGSKDWVATLDWAIRKAGQKPETALSVLEGAYDNRHGAKGPPNGQSAWTAPLEIDPNPLIDIGIPQLKF